MCLQGQIEKSAQPSLLKHSPDSGNYVSKTQYAVFSIAGRSRKCALSIWWNSGSRLEVLHLHQNPQYIDDSLVQAR